MKCQLLSFAFITYIFPCGIAHAQENDDRRFKDPQYVYIKIGRSSEKIIFPVNITTIHVYDNRPDTTHIGLPYTKNIYLTELRTKQTLAEEVTLFFDYLNSGTKESKESVELFCFIKKLLLSDFITAPLNVQEKKDSEGKFDVAEKSGLRLQMEFYIKKGTDFIPVCRFDSSWTGDKEIFNKGGVYLENGLAACLKKVAAQPWEKILNSSKKLSWNDIESYNRRNGVVAILNAPPAKGVFVSFEDFKNNKVTYTDFTISSDKKGDFLYLKNASGQETLFTDLWGYSDGKDLFIYSANNFFKLYRSGNGYRFYGAKDYSKSRVMRLNFRLIDLVSPNSTYSKGSTRANYDLVKNYLQIDVDTGEIY